MEPLGAAILELIRAIVRNPDAVTVTESMEDHREFVVGVAQNDLALIQSKLGEIKTIAGSISEWRKDKEISIEMVTA